MINLPYSLGFTRSAVPNLQMYTMQSVPSQTMGMGNTAGTPAFMSQSMPFQSANLVQLFTMMLSLMLMTLFNQGGNRFSNSSNQGFNDNASNQRFFAHSSPLRTNDASSHGKNTRQTGQTHGPVNQSRSSAGTSRTPSKPGAANAITSRTGVPAGTKLTRHDGNIVITKPGTILDGLDIHGTVKVKAPNVTIKNCIIRGNDKGKPDDTLLSARSTGTVIQNCEIVPINPGVQNTGIKGSGFMMTGTNIHGSVDCIQIYGGGNVTIKDSWLHDNVYYLHDPAHNGGPSHNDGIQIQDGRNIQVINTVIEDAQNAGVMMTQDTGKIDNVVFDGVVFNTPNAGINIHDNKNRGAMTNIVLNNSTFNPTVKYAVIAQQASTPRTSNNIYRGTNQTVKVKRG